MNTYKTAKDFKMNKPHKISEIKALIKAAYPNVKPSKIVVKKDHCNNYKFNAWVDGKQIFQGVYGCDIESALKGVYCSYDFFLASRLDGSCAVYESFAECDIKNKFQNH